MKSQNNIHILILSLFYLCSVQAQQQPIWPISNTVANYNQINTTFAEKHTRFHGGIDTHTGMEEFLAMLDGKVFNNASANDFFVAHHEFLDQNDIYSNFKKIRYGDKTDNLPGINNFAAITQGQAIGEVVATINVHLHFEMWIRDCLSNSCEWYLVDPLNNPHLNYQNQPPGYNDIYDVELNDIILEPQDNSSGIIFNQGDGLTAWHFNSCKIHKKDRPDSQGDIHGYYGSPITVFGNILPTVHVRDAEVTNGINDTGEGLGIYECLYYINDELKYWVRFDELQEIYKPDWATFFNHKYNTAANQSVLYGNHDYIKMHRLTTDQYSAPHKVIDRGIWKTRAKQGSINETTDIPENAEYPDDNYDVDFSVLDAAGNRDDASNRIKVDNFLPFITSFHLYSDAGTLFEYNRTQDENGNTLDNGLLTNESATFDNSNSAFLFYFGKSLQVFNSMIIEINFVKM